MADRLTITTDETRGGAPCDIRGRRLAATAGYLLTTPRVAPDCSQSIWISARRDSVLIGWTSSGYYRGHE